MRDIDPNASEFITSGYLSRSKPGGQLYDVGSIVGGGLGFLVGGPTGAMVGAQIGGSLSGQQAAKDASNAQVQAADQANATQRYMYDQTRADNAPFRDAGVAANNRLVEMMKGGQFDRRFTQADMDADPVYQNGLKFGLDQGTQGINRQAAAGGSFLSGATLKALTKYGNDYGSTKANESYNRFNNDQATQYNRYAGLSGAGQQATNQISAAGQNMANQVGQNQLNAGDARASGYVGGTKALNTGVGNALNYWQQNRMFNDYGGGQSGYYSDPTMIPMQPGGGY